MRRTIDLMCHMWHIKNTSYLNLMCTTFTALIDSKRIIHLEKFRHGMYNGYQMTAIDCSLRFTVYDSKTLA